MLRTTWVSIKEVASISLTGLSPSAARFPNTIQLWMHFVTPPKDCSPSLMDPNPNPKVVQGLVLPLDYRTHITLTSQQLTSLTLLPL